MPISAVGLAIRTIRKRPGHPSLVILTLAFGIGASVAVLSIADGVLMRPLPVTDQDRLVLVDKFVPGSPDPSPFPMVDLDAMEALHPFQAVAAVAYVAPSSYPARFRGQGFRARVTGVGANFFGVLGAKPALGRLSYGQTARFDRQFMAVISYSFWRSHFGGDSTIIGKALEIFQPFPIVGVAPPGFDFPHRDQAAVRWPALVVAIAITAVASLVIGVGGGLWTTRAEPFDELRNSRSAGRRSTDRIHEFLLGTQIAFAVLLTVGAGLLLRSWNELVTVDLGIKAPSLTVVQVTRNALLQDTSYTKEYAFYHDLLERVGRSPGVEAVAAGTVHPFSETDGWTGSWTLPGEDQSASSKHPMADLDGVTATYFRTMGIPLLGGRTFDSGDLTGPRVAIVSAEFARRAWPDQKPLGKVFKLGIANYASPWFTVIGVAADSRFRRLAVAAPLTIYLPGERQDSSDSFIPDYLVIRSSLAAGTVGGLVRRFALELAPTATAFQPITVTEAHRAAVARPRFNAFLLAAFALIALVLTGIGTFGVVSAFVHQRLHEIGIRLAIGARAADVRSLILGRALRIAAVGVLAGVGAALLTTRFIRALLYGVSATDPTTLSAVVGLILGVTVVACLAPIRRAARVDPLTVLKAE